MNKQDEDKARANSIATNNLDRCFGNNQMYGATCALEMASWKEQQMIEKAILFLRRHNCTIAATIGTGKAKQFIIEIEDFKKYMEEN